MELVVPCQQAVPPRSCDQEHRRPLAHPRILRPLGLECSALWEMAYPTLRRARLMNPYALATPAAIDADANDAYANDWCGPANRCGNSSVSRGCPWRSIRRSPCHNRQHGGRESRGGRTARWRHPKGPDRPSRTRQAWRRTSGVSVRRRQATGVLAHRLRQEREGKSQRGGT